ncbi:MAG: hypothetical protein V1725_06280 [archaeon]
MNGSLDFHFLLEAIMISIIVLFIFGCVNGAYHSLTNADDRQVSLNNFNALATGMQSLVNVQDRVMVQGMTFSLPARVYVVGFDSEWNENVKQAGLTDDSSYEGVHKPQQCLVNEHSPEDACLCLYENEQFAYMHGSENRFGKLSPEERIKAYEKPIMACYVFSSKPDVAGRFKPIVFLSTWASSDSPVAENAKKPFFATVRPDQPPYAGVLGSKDNEAGKYAFLIFKGNDKTHTLYYEKYETDEKIYIYLTTKVATQDLSFREYELKKQAGYCSDNSHANCAGKTIGTSIGTGRYGNTLDEWYAVSQGRYAQAAPSAVCNGRFTCEPISEEKGCRIVCQPYCIEQCKDQNCKAAVITEKCECNGIKFSGYCACTQDVTTGTCPAIDGIPTLLYHDQVIQGYGDALQQCIAEHIADDAYVEDQLKSIVHYASDDYADCSFERLDGDDAFSACEHDVCMASANPSCVIAAEDRCTPRR